MGHSHIGSYSSKAPIQALKGTPISHSNPCLAKVSTMLLSHLPPQIHKCQRRLPCWFNNISTRYGEKTYCNEICWNIIVIHTGPLKFSHLAKLMQIVDSKLLAGASVFIKTPTLRPWCLVIPAASRNITRSLTRQHIMQGFVSARREFFAAIKLCAYHLLIFVHGIDGIHASSY